MNAKYYDWDDVSAGACSPDQVWTPKKGAAKDAPHPLLAGLDPDHPDTDRAILRRLYHADPKAFLDAYGTAGINKLMDIAVKDERPERLPPVTDPVEWGKIVKTVVRMANEVGDTGRLATPVLHLCMLHECGNDPVRMAHTILEQARK